ncbi:MAG: ubiE 1 [Verrucomicrobiaceae bacterium]|nr:ubiE 1 [Verrucomicrobiaceae bacterium]
MEDRHWWYDVLRGMTMRVLTGLSARGRLDVLDAGCGTGGMMEVMKTGRPGWLLHGIEKEPAAIVYCRERGLINVCCGSVCSLPFADGTFDAVLSLDVLYHVDVNPELALNEMARVLKPGGLAVINLPAFNVLRGSHDVAVCGIRRYTACQVRDLLQRHRLCVQMIHYWNAWLFMPLLLRRQWSRRLGAGACPESDLSMPLDPLNTALALAGRLDAWLCRVLHVPFGTSVFAVASSPGTSRR